jgi:hypothetical protein
MASAEQEKNLAANLRRKKRQASRSSRIGSLFGTQRKVGKKQDSQKTLRNQRMNRKIEGSPNNITDGSFKSGVKKETKNPGEKTQRGNTGQADTESSKLDLENGATLKDSPLVKSNKDEDGIKKRTEENSGRPKGNASRWGDKEWEQMSDSLGKEENEQNTNAVGPATDEKIEKENKFDEENDSSENTEKKQGEDLKKEKNKKKQQQKPTEEENLKKNLQAASKPGAPPQLQALAAASKIPGLGSIIVSIMIKLLHLNRGLSAIGIITVLPMLIWPPLIFSYITTSATIAWLNKMPISKAIITAIMIPSNIRKDFAMVLGKGEQKEVRSNAPKEKTGGKQSEEKKRPKRRKNRRSRTSS